MSEQLCLNCLPIYPCWFEPRPYNLPSTVKKSECSFPQATLDGMKAISFFLGMRTCFWELPNIFGEVPSRVSWWIPKEPSWFSAFWPHAKSSKFMFETGSRSLSYSTFLMGNLGTIWRMLRVSSDIFSADTSCLGPSFMTYSTDSFYYISFWGDISLYIKFPSESVLD